MNHQSEKVNGKAIIISAPSGSGKTTIAKHLLKRLSNLEFSISACTREPRSDKETDGVDYYFLTVDEFLKKIDRGEFVEWEEVYDGMFYGTLKSEVNRLWSSGKHILFDVDVKGAVQLKKYFGDKALSVFIKAPSLEAIEKRLSSRQTESKASLEIRMAKVQSELGFEKKFDAVILNEDLERAFREAENLVQKFLSK